MTYRENIRLGLTGLLTHKLRSFLTMLGIIFGVGAVVAMQSIGAGARKEMLEAIKTLGVNNIIIRWNETDGDELAEAITKNPNQLSLKDVESLRSILEDVTAIVPVRHDEMMVRVPEEIEVNLVGTTPEYAPLHNMHISAGRFLTESDLGTNKSVGVITRNLKRKLFPLTHGIGEQIKIGNQWISIVGVLDQFAGSMEIDDFDSRDTSQDIYIPLTTMMTRFGAEESRSPLQEIVIQVIDSEMIVPVSAVTHKVLNRLHREVKDFQVIIPIELLHQSQQTQRIFNIVMGAIASISLLVGGIGIMNIMLSSVLERTREIGVRRAVGATSQDVVTQFLIEAVLLCVIGGLFGVILGAGMAWGITLYAGWETVIGPIGIILAFGVSATIGIIFGWWPAKKASKMDVINALRYE